MFFAQQHIFTQLGHTVPIESTPHFEFLKGDIEAYRAYLSMSWQYYVPHHTPAEIEKRVKIYRDLVEDITQRGVHTPVVVFVRPNGDTMIFDGNHRAAICAFYGLELPRKYIPLIDAIDRLMGLSKERYGAPKGVPYQSIYSPGGSMILKGRRTDIAERTKLILPVDILGKNVIDVGCNYGNALMLSQGAETLTGTDVDLNILTAAVRLAVIFKKQIDYRVWDMNKMPTHLGQYDTAFIFSVDAHLDTLAGLEYFIKHNVRGVVYYETHEGHSMPQTIKAFFSDTKLMGKLGARHLYRCVK